MFAILIATVIASSSTPSPSPTISPLPAPVVQWYAQRGAVASGLDVAFVRAVIDAESGGDPKAVSKAGAAGLMQLQPDTASDCGIHDRFDAAQNVDCGAKTLAWLVHKYGMENGVAAYNFGAGNVDSVGGHFTKMPAETQNYVKGVIAEYDDLQHEALEAGQAPFDPSDPTLPATFDATLSREPFLFYLGPDPCGISTPATVPDVGILALECLAHSARPGGDITFLEKPL
jgi:hypothetical protein